MMDQHTENTNQHHDQLRSGELSSHNFESYRQECDDQSALSRKQGIFLPEFYEAALEDEKTVIATSESGLKVPIATPVEHIPGLNQEFFSRSFPEGVLYVNPLLLAQEDYPALARQTAQAAVENSASIFYEFSLENDYGTREFVSMVAENMRELGYETELNDLEDPAVPDTHEAFKPASMILFEGNLMHGGPRQIHQETTEGGEEQTLSEAFWSGVERGVIPADTENGSAIYSGDQLVGNEELIKELWAAYEDRFAELGANYPVSLEDSFEEFVEMITRPDTMTAIAFADSEVACFTYLLKDFETAAWLNPSSLNEQYPSEKPYYFPGIVSRRDKSGRALEVLYAIGRASKFDEQDFKILYECTNHSATYIPEILEKAAAHSGLVTIANKQVETIAYRVISPKKRS